MAEGLPSIINDLQDKREAIVRQGKVTAVAAGPPRSATVLVAGASLAGVRCMDHVDLVVNEGVYILDLGPGRWIIIGSNSSVQTGGARWQGSSYFGGTVNMTGASSNWFQWTATGVAAPAFTTRSVGTKLVLYPQITGSAVDYALGIESNTLWSSVPSSAAGFKWYAATTAISTLSGAGLLTTTGGVSTTSFTASAMSTFTATGETVKMAGSNPYISMWDATATTRTGYIQGVAASDVRIVADAGSPSILIGAGTVSIRDGTLTTIRATVNSSGLTVNSGGFTITDGAVSLNANGAQRLAITSGGVVAINMAVSNGGQICTPDTVGVMTRIASREVLKERIESIPNSDSTARIMGLRPVEFYFKRGVLSDDNDYTSFDLQRGFVAEEVALVDHHLASWGWVDPADEYRTLSMELLDNQPDLDDAVPVMWNVFATITDIVGALQDALTRVEYLETLIP